MKHKPVVVIESHIPGILVQLAANFELRRLPPERIDADAVRDADALIVRTRTRCDAALLDGSKVRFVATATIGTDHIDLEYCHNRAIKAVSAPGCNAPAVAQYVAASLLTLFPDGLAGKRIGIVGAGHVGSSVAHIAPRLGMETLLCDPPRAREEGPAAFVDLATIAHEADIITFHVPHTTTGVDATHHMADADFFNALERKPVIINSARGPVTETAALIEALRGSSVRHAVIDCWEGEPTIDRQLLSLASIATPHIAGYSFEGKMRATRAVIKALCEHFAAPLPDDIDSMVPPVAPAETYHDRLTFARHILSTYDPLSDTEALRSHPENFERLRNTYNLRHEAF